MTNLTKSLLAGVFILIICITYATFAAIVGHLPVAAAIAGLSGAVVIKALHEAWT